MCGMCDARTTPSRSQRACVSSFGEKQLRHLASVSLTCGQFHENGPQNTKQLNFCKKYVTGIIGKLNMCSFLCKKNYMIIDIRVNFVDI